MIDHACAELKEKFDNAGCPIPFHFANRIDTR